MSVDSADFPLAGTPILELLRDAASLATVGAVSVAALGLALPFLRRRLRWLAPHAGLYILLLYGFGPGLLVNGVMKNFFSRARPRDVLDFGGSLPFTPVWAVEGGCRGNCSFVSGEGAAAAAILCLVPLFPRRARPAAALGLGSVALALSVGRIAAGAHFLSDVILSWLVVALVAALLGAGLLGDRASRIDAGFARLVGAVRIPSPSTLPASPPPRGKAS